MKTSLPSKTIVMLALILFLSITIENGLAHASSYVPAASFAIGQSIENMYETGIDVFTGNERMLGWTNNTGLGPNATADGYSMYEEVMLYASVLYYGDPREGHLVTWDVRDAEDGLVLYDATYTNGSGIANITFRNLPENVLGIWSVFVTVHMAGEPYMDWLWFDVFWHDVAVLNVACDAEAYPYWYPEITPPPGGTLITFEITVVVKNNGSVPETFNVTTYYDNETYTGTVGTQVTTNLAPNTQKILKFSWGLWYLPASTSLRVVRYTISANVTTVVFRETELENNFKVDGVVKMKWPGNTNGDDQVNIKDVHPLVKAWHSEPGDPEWDPRCDFNRDGIIDMCDVQVIVKQWYNMP